MLNRPECPLPQKPEWSNSILQRNTKTRCVYCGDLIKHNAWFKTRQDNGIVLVFCTQVCEHKYDARPIGEL